MSDELHVVFGAGWSSSGESTGLMGVAVRSISRHRPTDLDEGVDWRSADLTDPEAAIDAAKGPASSISASTLPTPGRPSCFPPSQRSVIAAAEGADARLVTLENVYGYGPTAGKPITEAMSRRCPRRRPRAGPARR